MEILQSLLQVFSEISGSGKPVIINSRGDFFSQGYDSSCKLIRDSEFVGNIIAIGTAVMQLIRNHNGVVLTYATGHAWGAALELGLVSDAFISGDKCDFAYPDASFGLPSIFIDPVTMKENLGERMFSRLLSGEIINSSDALSSGITSGRGNFQKAIDVAIKLNNATFLSAKEGENIDQSRIRNHIRYARSMDTSKIDLKGLESHRSSFL